MSRNNRRPRQTFGRLSLEHLEARDVPAAFDYVWAPPSGIPGMPPPPPPSYSTLTNWRVGLGPTNFATELPDGDDHLFFVGGVSSANCTIPVQTVTSGQNTFAGTDGKIFLTSGRLEIPRRVIGTTPAEDPVATLKATTVKLGEAAVVVMTTAEWSTLRVEGDFIYEGEFRAAIGRATDRCDQIITTGDVTVVTDKAKLTLRWDTSVPLMGQRVWPVVKSEMREVSDEPQDNLATLDEGNALQVLLSADEKEIRVSRRVD